VRSTGALHSQGCSTTFVLFYPAGVVHMCYGHLRRSKLVWGCRRGMEIGTPGQPPHINLRTSVLALKLIGICGMIGLTLTLSPSTFSRGRISSRYGQHCVIKELRAGNFASSKMEDMAKACDLRMAIRAHDQSRRPTIHGVHVYGEIMYAVLTASKSLGMPWSTCYTRGPLRHDPMISRLCLGEELAQCHEI
jgi:hypothetical protein